MAKFEASEIRLAYINYVLEYLGQNPEVLRAKNYYSIESLLLRERNIKDFDRDNFKNIYKALLKKTKLPSNDTMIIIGLKFKIPVQFHEFEGQILRRENPEFIKYVETKQTKPEQIQVESLEVESIENETLIENDTTIDVEQSEEDAIPQTVNSENSTNSNPEIVTDAPVIKPINKKRSPLFFIIIVILIGGIIGAAFFYKKPSNQVVANVGLDSVKSSDTIKNQLRSAKDSEKTMSPVTPPNPTDTLPKNDTINKAHSLQDANGIYIVKIGRQIWMEDNLDIDHYRDGTKIPEAKTTEDWIKYCNEGRGCWCYYENKKNPVGKLYNWFVAEDTAHGGIAPRGWKVPTLDDFTKLLEIVGEKGKNHAGRYGSAPHEIWRPHLVVKKHTWLNVPAGVRVSDGYFASLGKHGYWWSSESSVSGGGDAFVLIDNIYPKFETYNLCAGFSIRLMKAHTK